MVSMQQKVLYKRNTETERERERREKDSDSWELLDRDTSWNVS